MNSDCTNIVPKNDDDYSSLWEIADLAFEELKTEELKTEELKDN